MTLQAVHFSLRRYYKSAGNFLPKHRVQVEQVDRAKRASHRQFSGIQPSSHVPLGIIYASISSLRLWRARTTFSPIRGSAGRLIQQVVDGSNQGLHAISRASEKIRFTGSKMVS